MSNKKVLLIGWDGADWKVIRPLLDAGVLPNLQRLIENGTTGKLSTLDPPFSPMLWTSIATGKRPYKHGVLGFYEADPAGESVRPVLSLSRQCKAIWNILSQQNYTTHSVGWWPSHPAEPINGVAISNFYQRSGTHTPDNWPLTPNSVFPSSLEDVFAKLRIHPAELTGAHIQPFIPGLGNMYGKSDELVTRLIQILAENSTLHAAFTHIIRTQDWNFATVYYDGIDRVSHEFMKYHPPHRSHIPKDEFDLFHEVVKGIYIFSDMMLGRLLDLAGEDTAIFLVSDHGFHPDHLRPREIPFEPAGIAYEHSPYGIFCAKGPQIKKNNQVHGASVLDITPTILHMLGMPVGDDMDGFPLISIFEKPHPPRTIPSWEEVPGEAGMPSMDLMENVSFVDQMLNQLVELGYIDRPHEDKSKAVQDARRFCNINLARAYLDGGEIESATSLFEQLHHQNPNIPWIAYRLAVCYQISGQHEKCRRIIELLRDKHFYKETFIDLIEASLLMGEGAYGEALDMLKKTEADIPDNTQNIYLEIGRCYSMLGAPDKAIQALEKELEINFDNAEAHQFMGAIHFRQGRFEQAAERLLSAVSLNYDSAQAHYLLGRTLLAQGYYAEAADAFEVSLEMSPFNNHARQLLAYTCRAHLQDPAKASLVMQDFEKYLLGTIVVVTGLPRSGTSMMMQMLANGGFPIFTDGERKADANNPKGYYEHQVVKKITHNTQWLKGARDKAVKIVVPLISYLPYNYRYKIIFMERDVDEIYFSQKRMIARLGGKSNMDELSLNMIKALENSISTSKESLTQHPCTEVVYVRYHDVLHAPMEAALRINELLDHILDPLAMVKVVDPDLYREKIASQ